MQRERRVNLKTNPGTFKSFFKEYGTRGNILKSFGVLSVAGLVGYAVKAHVFRDLISRFRQGNLNDVNLPVTT